MAFFRLLNGLFISGATSVIFAYLGEFLNAKNRSRSMMAASVIFGIFCVSLPLMAWLVINQKWSFIIPGLQVLYRPWRLFLMACGAPSLICGIFLIFFPESPKYTFSQVRSKRISFMHLHSFIFKGDELKTLDIFRRIYTINTGSINYPVYRIKPNEEFGQALERKNVGRMMLDQTLSLIREYPRSITIISTLQFGIYFVCNGMLLFFPDILNQTANYQKHSRGDVDMCEIVESAIEERKVRMTQNNHICINELDISAYYYAIILECCYASGFLIISFLVNYIGRLSIFSFIFFTTGLCGILISVVGSPTISTYLYVWLLVSGVNNSLMNTVTYDLFPTTLRSLAMSLSLMFGRLGGLNCVA
jgi:MFS transporter, VNT family, synaptic vesicle glycoprotein 2